MKSNEECFSIVNHNRYIRTTTKKKKKKKKKGKKGKKRRKVDEDRIRILLYEVREVKREEKKQERQYR